MTTQEVSLKKHLLDFNDSLHLKKGFLKNRILYLCIGSLISPAALCIGLFRIIYSTSKISIQLLYRQTQGVTAPIYKPFFIKLAKPNKTKSQLVEQWIQQVKASLLLLVPFIGPQLSAHYQAMGSLLGFEKTTPIATILLLFNLQIPQYIYLSDEQKRRQYPLNDNFTEEQKKLEFVKKKQELMSETAWQKEYLQLPRPSLQVTSTIIDQAIKESRPAVQLRIPVGTTAKTRFHDATLLFSSEFKKDAPIVVMYHGNKGHRDDFRGTRTIEKFLEKGYNVLLSAYSGDYITEYKGEKTIDDLGFIPTPCKEIRMRQDAAADVEFLSSRLKTNRVAVYGYSLGGAQAMNFAQAVSKNDKLNMDFVVLDKTFTNSWSVIQNTVNSLFLKKYNRRFEIAGRLASDITRHHFFSETRHARKKGIDGLNSEKKLVEVLKKENFKSTKFLFIGAQNDFLMGVQKTYDKIKGFQGDASKNFATELFFIANSVIALISSITPVTLPVSSGEKSEIVGNVDEIKAIAANSIKKPSQKVELQKQFGCDHCSRADISSFIDSL